ncbi:MAG TPA: phosphate-starvation-inducible protein PsiE [Ureibacillus sp.]|nr:phosphate-starvation-inducible protein PsiE [Ureibacillus sp.]
MGNKLKFKEMILLIPIILQYLLNGSLIVLAILLSFQLLREILEFVRILVIYEVYDYKNFLANILIFFLYFEFITMIVKYFKEDYHFPLRYFLYIGITAMIRLIIVEHEHPQDTLLYSIVILVLIICYFIINLTPHERPKQPWLYKNKE